MRYKNVTYNYCHTKMTETLREEKDINFRSGDRMTGKGAREK